MVALDLGLIGKVVGLVVFLVSVIGATYALARQQISHQTKDLWKDEAEVLTKRLITVETGQRECLERELGLLERLNDLERQPKEPEP